MGELKPIGSEKLKGDEKIRRILDLTYYQSDEVLKESTKSTKEGKSGVYGIEREKDGYYVKKGLNENSLDYIGGMFMKNKNRFNSYAEAYKKMEFLIEQEKSEEKKILEEETEVVEEATKYVLKQKNSAPAPAPAPEPAAALPPEDTAPVPEPDMGTEPDTSGDEGIEDPNDFMKVLKKLAGKLQQKFEEYSDQLESEDYTEILKQVISGVDVEKLEESDLEDIISEFEGEVPEEGGDLPDELPTDDEAVVPQETAETDDLDGIASLEELIDTPLDDEEEDELVGFDDSFLNDPEIARAGKLAKKDMDSELTNDPENSEFEVDFEDESDIDEQIPFSGPAEEEEIKEIDLDELTELINSNVKQSLGKYFE